MKSFNNWITTPPFFYGWFIVGAAGISMFAGTAAAASTVSIFVKPMSDELGWSRTAISGGISFATLLGAVVAPIAGRWLDRYGGRMLLGAGGAITGVALLGMGFVQNLFMFYLLYPIARSIFMGSTNLAATTVVANWFVRRRAMATAWVFLMDRIGLGLWPLVAALLFSAVDWRMAWWVMGSLVLIMSLVPAVFIVARQPEDLGLLPDGDQPKTATLNSIQKNDRSATNEGGGTKEAQWTVREATRTPAFWLLSFSAMAIAFAGGGLGVHRIPFFVERGMDSSVAGFLLICFATGIAMGGFLAARLSTWIPFQKIIGFQMLGGALLMPVLLNLPPGPVAFGYVWVEGLILGGSFTLIPVIFAEFYGRASLGSIRGLSHFFLVIGNAMGPLSAGLFYDAFGKTYTWAFICFGVVLAIGAFTAWIAKAPKPQSLQAEL
jgi:OFA family oxalate/formate antiporter-like MFS transporter